MKEDTTVIIGGGVSGLTAAIEIARSYGMRVIILEQGMTYSKRQFDSAVENNLCGLGGAGTLGGGKFCFPPASSGVWIKSPPTAKAFGQFYNSFFSNLPVNCYSEKASLNSILSGNDCGLKYKYYPTQLLFQNDMKKWMEHLIARAEDAGVVIRCGCRLRDMERCGNRYMLFLDSEVGRVESLEADRIVFATGRTSVSLLHRIFGDTNMSTPRPDLGIRMSVQLDAPLFSRIGADVKIKSQVGNYLVRSFCVCSGGEGAAVSCNGHRYHDGHFGNNITDYTNLGVLARSPSLEGFSVAEDYIDCMQKYFNVEISLADFVKYKDEIAGCDKYRKLFHALEEFIDRLFYVGGIQQNKSDISVMLPSVDHFNPVIKTDKNFETNFPGIFVIGDAAGVSRGFVQAMWSGWCVAERIKKTAQWKTQLIVAS